MLRKIFTLALMLMVAGCADKAPPAKKTYSGGAVGYAQLRDQVLAPNCLSCHGGTQPPDLRTYALVKANIDKIKQVVFVVPSMPKRGPMGAEDLAMLGQWIADGGPEEGPAPVTKPTEKPTGEREVMKWDALKKKLLNARCSNCHYANNPDKISNLDDLEQFRGTIGTSYFLSVVSPSMPPPPKGTAEGAPNPNALTRAEKEMLSFWIVDGMQP